MSPQEKGDRRSFGGSKEELIRLVSEACATTGLQVNFNSDSQNEIHFHIHVHQGQGVTNVNTGLVQGVMGQGDVFQSAWQELASAVDVTCLSQELASLHLQIKGAKESQGANSELVATLAALIDARREISGGNGGRALKCLRGVGKWALEAAKEIGTSVAAAAIAKAHGLN